MVMLLCSFSKLLLIFTIYLLHIYFYFQKEVDARLYVYLCLLVYQSNIKMHTQRHSVSMESVLKLLIKEKQVIDQ